MRSPLQAPKDGFWALFVGAWVLVLLLLWLLLGDAAWGLERKFCGDLVIRKTGEQTKVVWDPNPPEENVTLYRLQWEDWISGVTWAWFDVPGVEWTGVPPRTGTFRLSLKAVGEGGLESDPTRSNDTDSTRSPEPWCYYVVPAPPGGGVIE